MENYKIKVNDLKIAEEVRDLFEQLGYWKSSFHDHKQFPRLILAKFTSSPYSTGCDISCPDADDCKELTHPQLRDLVAQSKNEQCLISGANAKLAWANGENVQISFDKKEWKDIVNNDRLLQFDQPCGFYRVKPRTIKLEIEIPAPFEPKHGERYWYLHSHSKDGYASDIFLTNQIVLNQFGAYRTEEEIKQVVAALRGLRDE